MLVYPSRSPTCTHPHTLSSPTTARTTTPFSFFPRSLPRSPRPRPRQVVDSQSLQKRAALNASLRWMKHQEKQAARKESEEKARKWQEEKERKEKEEAEWGEMENQEVSIIVTSWDDARKCWFPVEVFGPVGRELRMFVERRRAALLAQQAAGQQLKKELV